MFNLTKEKINEYKISGQKYIDNISKKKYCINEEKNYNDVLNLRTLPTISNLYDKKTFENISEMFLEKRSIPAGSIIYGLGNTERKTSLSNCYFIPINEDSIEGIYDACKEMARTYSWRGGCGTDITILRPKGSPTKNSSKSSTGAVSFMPTFEEVTCTIGQNGRRGALIISLDIRHPDVLDFIWSKSKPEKIFGVDNLSGKTKELSSCNISVKVTNSFMEAVISDKNFDLIFPDFSICKDLYDKEWDGNLDNWLTKKYPIKVYKTINARQLLKQISESSWLSGDPGVLFWDNVLYWSSGRFDDALIPSGTNPCLPISTPVLTMQGYKRLKDLKNEVFINNKSLSCSNVIKTGINQELYEITLKNGIKLYSTNNHKITVLESKKLIDIDVDKIDINIHKIKVDYSPIKYELDITDFEKGIIAGWIFGDGVFSQTKDNKRYASLSIGVKEFNQEIPLLNTLKKYLPDSDNFKFIPHYQKPDTCKILCIKRISQIDYLTDEIFKCKNKDDFDLLNHNISFQIGFISAITTCDGYAYNSINSKKNVSRKILLINQSGDRGYKILQEIQLVLASLGIYSALNISNHEKTDKRGIHCKTSWHLEIPDVETFNIHFIIYNTTKQNTITEICDTFGSVKRSRINSLKQYQKIKNIQKTEIKEDVFDITVPIENHFVASTIQVHNCGEQPLQKYGNCLLSSLVMYKYVNNPYTVNAEFNIDLFEKDVKHLVIFLDSMIDINEHPLEKQNITDKYGRRIGCEITGLADMCSMLNMEYCSNEFLEFIDNLYYIKTVIEINTSIELAKTKGCAPCFIDKDKRIDFLKQPYIQRILKKMLPSKKKVFETDIKRYGLRNSAFNTIGPTGTISILCDNCSSGIEPVWKILYNRDGMINNIETIFHYPLIKYGNLERFENITEEEIKKKFHYKTAFDIDYKSRIKLQSILQKWTDASISSTINLPNSATIEDIYNIYIEAFKSNLKGITIFRDESKKSIFSSIDKNNTIDDINVKHSEIRKIISDFLPKIKKQLREPHRSYRYIAKWLGEDVYSNIVLGKDDHPMEIFTKIPEEVATDKNTGMLNEGLYADYMSNWDSLCRLVSIGLRAGIPLDNIIKQLDKSSKLIGSIPSIISRLLKNTISLNGNFNIEETKEKIKSGEKIGDYCYSCKNNGLVHENGCTKCVLCGWSKCG